MDRTEIFKYDLTDTTSVTSPAYVAGLVRAIMASEELVIGVCDTGKRSVNGAELKWINSNFDVLENLDTSYFSTHPSWNFEPVGIGEHIFRRIPIAYTRRGIVPRGQYAGNWYVMLSPFPRAGFSAHKTAFTHNGILRDSFLWGSCLASLDNNGKACSKYDGAPFATTNIFDFENAVKANGDGYHVGTIQEWHEILTRMVIEKRTFNPFPLETRSLYNCEYRGILIYNPSDRVYSEWRAGIRVDKYGYLEWYRDDGSWEYEEGLLMMSTSMGMIKTLLNPEHIYLANKRSTSYTDAMIPDAQYTNNYSVVRYCRCDLRHEEGPSGVFNMDFYAMPDPSDEERSGGRVAFIE